MAEQSEDSGTAPGSPWAPCGWEKYTGRLSTQTPGVTETRTPRCPETLWYSHQRVFKKPEIGSLPRKQWHVAAGVMEGPRLIPASAPARPWPWAGSGGLWVTRPAPPRCCLPREHAPSAGWGAELGAESRWGGHPVAFVHAGGKRLAAAPSWVGGVGGVRRCWAGSARSKR